MIGTHINDIKALLYSIHWSYPDQRLPVSELFDFQNPGGQGDNAWCYDKVMAVLKAALTLGYCTAENSGFGASLTLSCDGVRLLNAIEMAA